MVRPESLSSFCKASAKDCMNDFDALYTVWNAQTLPSPLRAMSGRIRFASRTVEAVATSCPVATTAAYAGPRLPVPQVDPNGLDLGSVGADLVRRSLQLAVLAVSSRMIGWSTKTTAPRPARVPPPPSGNQAALLPSQRVGEV